MVGKAGKIITPNKKEMFRDPVSKNYRTQSLFWELAHSVGKQFCLYTLSDEDMVREINGEQRLLESVHKLYMDIADPTEYEFAMHCFAGWDHWQRMCEKTGQLAPHIEKWRTELAVKLRSHGVKRMYDFSEEDKGQQAAKWLAEKGWEPKTRGRPSKAEKERALKEDKAVSAEVDEHYSRLMQ